MFPLGEIVVGVFVILCVLGALLYAVLISK